MLIPIRDDNPTRRFPIVTVSLLLINFAIFIYMFTLPSESALNEFVTRYSLIPRSILQAATGQMVTANSLQPVYLTLITSMFLHGGILHIASNMLYLWIFGNNVEDFLGRVKFIVFYLVSGIAGSFMQMALDPASPIPNLGASGAISGVLAAYLILYPGARVLTILPILFFIQIIRIPALVLIGFWFILQLFSGLFTIGNTGGGVAYFAHIGGFLAGLVMTILLARRRPRRYYYGESD